MMFRRPVNTDGFLVKQSYITLTILVPQMLQIETMANPIKVTYLLVI